MYVTFAWGMITTLIKLCSLLSKRWKSKKPSAVLTFFLYDLFPQRLEPFDSRGIFINRFSIKKVKIVNVIIAINVLYVKRL